jgi:hypothetical protein
MQLGELLVVPCAAPGVVHDDASLTDAAACRNPRRPPAPRRGMRSMATLQFLGAPKTVTGSKYLLDAPGTRVMVDCGCSRDGRSSGRGAGTRFRSIRVQSAR